MDHIRAAVYSTLLTCISSTIIADDNPHCDMIAHLTGDYYQHRLDGLSKAEVKENYTPPFGNTDFLRTVDLAIEMAFSVPSNLRVEDLIEQVNSSCIKYQQ